MKLGEKILKYRKNKGLSQEELGEKVDVTRQTISNWELGETQPNPEQLKKLSKELGVSIDELLDNDVKDVLVERVTNTENTTKVVLTILKVLLVMIGLGIVLFIGLIVTRIVVKNSVDRGREMEMSIHCKLYGEEHSFGVTYYELTGEAFALGGDPYFSDILDLGKYDDAHQIMNVINDYVKKNGGTCHIVDDQDSSTVIDTHIKEGTLTNKSATVVLELQEKYEVVFGEDYYIEKEVNGKYEKLKYKDGKNCFWNDIGYTLEVGKPRELEINWEPCYGELSKGDYRIVKEFTFTSDDIGESYSPHHMFIYFYID